MQREAKSRSHVLALVAAVVALLASNWATGVSLAQEHDHESGEHDTAPPPAEEVSGADIGAQNPNQETTVVRYGPYDINGASGEGHHNHEHSGNRFELRVEKPCENCYITAMQAALVNPAGEEVGISTGPMLHHMVLYNNETGRSDATCSFGIGSLGQRFFASGDERTPVFFPEGYGYRVGNGSWNLIWDLANHSTEPQTVHYQVTFDWVPASQPMNDVEPIWFDVNQCGTSNISVPAGQSTVDWTWTANRSGEMVSLGGHQHGNSMDGGGDHVTVTNETTDVELCDSVAGYGETPMYVDHHGTEWLSSMSTCGSAGAYESLGSVSMGDRVTITGHYDQVQATDDQMGISVAYLADPPGGGGPGDGGSEDCSFLAELWGLCEREGGPPEAPTAAAS